MTFKGRTYPQQRRRGGIIIKQETFGTHIGGGDDSSLQAGLNIYKEKEE